MQDVVHVFPSRGRNKAFAGAVEFIGLSDSLSVGPSAPDPHAHGRLRRKFWKAVAGGVSIPHRPPKTDIWSAADVYRKVRGSGVTPVVLWCGPVWRERLSLWWALDALTRRGNRIKSLWLASPESVPRLRAEARSVNLYDSDELKEVFAAARRLTVNERLWGASRWREYTRPRPLQQTSRAGLKWLRAMDEYFNLFPRSEGRRFRLSAYDEVILSGLSSREWLRAIDLVSMRPSDRLDALFAYGDVVFLFRLNAWATWSAGVAERRPTGDKTMMRRHEYRLTALGEKLLAEGLPKMLWAPPFTVGACRAYDPVRPWVVYRRGTKQELRRRPGG